MNDKHDLSEILVNLIMDLNRCYTSSKKFKKIHLRMKLYEAKKKIKAIIKKDKYDATDIYRFLIFLKMANTLDVFKNIPKNIAYTCYRSEDPRVTSSGTLSVSISYDKYKTMDVHFKPIIGPSQNEISMEWIIQNTNTSIVDFKTVSSDTKKYSTIVNFLMDRFINPTEPVSQTKILEFSSASILYQAFIICVESIFDEIKMRYIYENKKK